MELELVPGGIILTNDKGESIEIEGGKILDLKTDHNGNVVKIKIKAENLLQLPPLPKPVPEPPSTPYKFYPAPSDGTGGTPTDPGFWGPSTGPEPDPWWVGTGRRCTTTDRSCTTTGDWFSIDKTSSSLDDTWTSMSAEERENFIKAITEGNIK